MQNDYLQYMVLIAWGVGMWLYGRLWHKGEARYPMFNHFIKAPEWLIFLCGRPRADDHLELAGIAFQLVMVLSLLLIPAFWVFSVAFMVRAYVFWLLQGVAMGLAFVVRVAVYLWKKFRHQ